jgi:Tfp pilus assembly protein PilF
MIGLRGIWMPLATCLAFALTTVPLRAETVEVAKDVRVTRKTYAAPIEEQPFFGFADKTVEQRAADERFVADVTRAAGTREKGYEAAVQRGWTMIDKGNFPDAARRFNQAYLLAPEQSAIYHGFAIIALARFKDQDYADELFKLAQKQPSPLKALKADYGRFLLVAKRPKEALATLDQAVVDAPNLPDAWSNLALARLQTGAPAAACAAAAEAGKLRLTPNVAGDLKILRQQASCQ